MASPTDEARPPSTMSTLSLVISSFIVDDADAGFSLSSRSTDSILRPRMPPLAFSSSTASWWPAIAGTP